MRDDLQFRRAPLAVAAGRAPRTLDAEARTVAVTFATEAPVRRRGRLPSGDYGDFDEVLSCDPSAVDLGRLNAGAPLLNSHGNWELRDVIGVVERATLEGGVGLAVLRFSERDDVAPIFADVAAGVLRNVSVGYRVAEWRWELGDGRNVPLARAVRWEPMEISLVPIPADPGAQVRALDPAAAGRGATLGDDSMTTAAASPAPTAPAALPDPVAADRARSGQILELAERHNLGADFAQRHVAAGTSLEAFRAAAFDMIATRQEAAPTHSQRAVIVDDHDAPDAMARAMAGALAHRASAGLVPLEGGSSRFAGHTPLDLARTWLEHRGGRSAAGLSAAEIMRRAVQLRAGGSHTVSDFPGLYGQATQAIALAAFDRGRSDLLPCCSRLTVPDLTTYRRLRLGEGPLPQPIGESGEVTYASTGEEYEFIKADSYAINYSITREMLLNDRLGLWGQFAITFGQGAAAREAGLIAAVFTSNPNLRDGLPVWGSGRGNVQSVAMTFSQLALNDARALLRGLPTVDGGAPANLAPAWLVVPAKYEGEARTLMAAEYTGGPAIDPNSVRGMAQVVTDARIDAATVGHFWLLPDPVVAPCVEVVHLDGSRPGSTTDGAPLVESFEGPDVLGQVQRLVFDVGAAAVGWRSVRGTTDNSAP